MSVLCCNERCDPGLITLPTLGLSFPHFKNEVGVEASCSLRPLLSSSAILVCVSLDSDSVGALCLDSLLCQADCLVFDLSTLFFHLDPLTFFCFVVCVRAFSFISFKAAEAALLLGDKRRSSLSCSTSLFPIIIPFLLTTW